MDVDQLQEDIAEVALGLPSALTPEYEATLDAVDLLEVGSAGKAASRLRDAASLVRDPDKESEFEALAERAEEVA